MGFVADNPGEGRRRAAALTTNMPLLAEGRSADSFYRTIFAAYNTVEVSSSFERRRSMTNDLLSDA